MRRYRLIALMVGCLLVATGGSAQQTAQTAVPIWPDHVTAHALLEAFELIKAEYVTRDIDETALWQGALAGMLAALPDRYSHYRSPQELAREQESIAGAIVGIGALLIDMNLVTGTGIQLRGVIEGGPAERAGLRPGDVILEAAGVDLREATLDVAVAVLRGEPGSTVRLVVGRPGTTEPLIFDLERAPVTVPASVFVEVESHLLPGDIGYLAIRDFAGERVHEQVVEHLASLTEAGATSLVLDLRDNTGGSFRPGYDVLDEFIARGVVWRERRRGIPSLAAINNGRANELPMVVLVNSRTLSMAEVVATALQESGRAVVVGEPTLGKGVSNWNFDLIDGSVANIVVGEWLTPSGMWLEGVGMNPDIPAPETRRSKTVLANGTGVNPGQVVELVVDGVVVARTVAGEAGFDLVGVAGGGQYVAAPAWPPDPMTDGALRTALDTLASLREGADD